MGLRGLASLNYGFFAFIFIPIDLWRLLTSEMSRYPEQALRFQVACVFLSAVAIVLASATWTHLHGAAFGALLGVGGASQCAYMAAPVGNAGGNSLGEQLDVFALWDFRNNQPLHHSSTNYRAGKVRFGAYPMVGGAKEWQRGKRDHLRFQ